MQWLFLLLAFAAMAMAFLAKSTAVLALGLIAALVLFGLWAMSRYTARVASQGRDVSMMIDPSELRRLREIAEARKAAGNDAPPSP